VCKVCVTLNSISAPSFDGGMTDTCVEARQVEQGILVVVRGKAPLCEAEILLGQARTAILAGQDIQLDLREVEHLHAGVLQVLIAFERAARKKGVRFELLGQSEPARATLALAGLANWPQAQVQ